MSCTCIELINQAFERAGSNTVLDIPIQISMSSGEVTEPMVQIAVMKRDPKSRKRPNFIVPKYCPFCAAEYAQ